MAVWVGTSGYSYPDWVGRFYPPNTRPKDMLVHYSRQFPLVELNYTFYRTPTTAQLVRLAAQTPAGFQFLVKLPKTLSHDRKRDDLAAFRRAEEALQERARLLGLLCQFPQSTHYDREGRAWIEMLARELPGTPLAVEFRHHSWATPAVPSWLAEHGIDLVSVDVPDIRALYPRGLVSSGRRVYVRFHSRAAGNWYSSHGERYDYDYSEQQLMDWAKAIGPASEQGKDVFLLFNNCFDGRAAQNAQQMQAIIRRLSPHVLVSPPDEKRRTLFD
jgi:uncharacterized protein YecE (DUF72 family)